MKKNLIYMTLVLLVVLFSCQSKDKNEGYSKIRQEQEPLGAQCLDKARTYLASQDFDAAIKEVLSVSKLYPHAISAREQGILLLDSIQLLQSKKELETFVADHPNDSVTDARYSSQFEDLCNKVTFYTKKLEHDRQVKVKETRQEK